MRSWQAESFISRIANDVADENNKPSNENNDNFFNSQDKWTEEDDTPSFIRKRLNNQ